MHQGTANHSVRKAWAAVFEHWDDPSWGLEVSARLLVLPGVISTKSPGHSERMSLISYMMSPGSGEAVKRRFSR